MNALLRSASFAALVICASSPARADDVTTLTSKLCSAAGAVTSFIVNVQMTGTTGVGGTMTFVRPHNVKSEMRVGELSVESYFIDGFMYMHLPTGGWQRTNTAGINAPQQTMNVADTLKPAQVTVLPDRREHGVAVGVIQVDVQLPGTAVSQLPGSSGSQTPGTPESQLIQAAHRMVCTYNKKSYFMQTCANGLVTLGYDKYDDPANVVVLPPQAKNAVPVVIWTPSTPAPVSSGPPAASAAPVSAPAPAATSTSADSPNPNPNPTASP